MTEIDKQIIIYKDIPFDLITNEILDDTYYTAHIDTKNAFYSYSDENYFNVIEYAHKCIDEELGGIE